MRSFLFSFFLTISLLCFVACSEDSNTSNNKMAGSAAQALTAVEYDYLTKDYPENPDAPLDKGLTKAEIFSRKTEIDYQGEDAKFTFVAYTVKRNTDEKAVAILIKMDIDRLFTTLGGAPQRKQDAKYFCIPSHKSSSELYKRYNSAIQDLGFKDYEIYLDNLSRLLAKVHT